MDNQAFVVLERKILRGYKTHKRLIVNGIIKQFGRLLDRFNPEINYPPHTKVYFASNLVVERVMPKTVSLLNGIFCKIR